ncbi:hypothetical protein [Streptomyces sp. SID13726]|uniref:hypothetical protein n=1 Tax=Streptomyces sp. SID13726 TaxID=2706058 RepID=UPI0013B6E54A|nr:hypothetical protein [Streptomyces sp. SID13726]NEA97709.1 hypothetical protein [Streptomyces sp. SID13726]
MNDEITATDGDCLFVFDGRILERFGRDPVRFHVRYMHLNVTGPDRKGRRNVMIAHGRPDSPGASFSWTYTAAEWERARGFAELLEVVRTAVESGSDAGLV